jgi:hypothetical protein
MSLRSRITWLVFGLFAVTGTVVLPLLSYVFVTSFAAPLSLRIALWAVGLVGVCTGVAWLLLGEILRPLSSLAATARELDTRQLSRRVDLSSKAGEFRS